MALDLSKLSPEDLEALKNNELDKLSDQGLNYLHQNAAEETPEQQQTNAVFNQNGPVSPDQTPGIGTALAGGAQVAAQHLMPPVAEAAKFAVQHPIESSLAASYVPGVNKLPGISDIAAARQALYNKYIAPNASKSIPAQFKEVTPSVGNAAPETAKVAEEASHHSKIMEAMKDLYQKYGPKVVEHADAISKAARLGGTFLAGMTPATLNSGEQERMDQIRKMQQQQNPQLPNALNSGFSQQLNQDLNR